MPLDTAWLFRALVSLTLIGVPLYAMHARGRRYGIFALVILLLSLPGAVVSQLRLAVWAPENWRLLLDVFWIWGVTAAALHLAHLVRARLRSRVFRALVSVPGQAFVAAGFLAGFWQLLLLPLRLVLPGSEADGWQRLALAGLDALPLALAAFSVSTSSRGALEWVRIHTTGEPAGADGAVVRVPVERHRRPPAPLARRPLRLVQISDPHLGPWQSVSRLRRTLAALLRHEPDLVLLTGDFLTMEARGSPGSLAAALEPLRAVSERCYAIFGNHDHEDPDEVRGGLAANGVRLLLDESAMASTPVGPVQILGADYVGRGRREHLESLLEQHPRRGDVPRILLLHDPLGFQHVPPGAVDLTLSGHTHGGQIGLVSFGLGWTVLSRSAWPDHGLFARGPNRLYVHRGTGFYGFPLRVGVPGETSVIEWVV